MQRTTLQSCNGHLDRRRITQPVKSRENQQLNISWISEVQAKASKPKSHCCHWAPVPCTSSGCGLALWQHFVLMSCLKPFTSVLVVLQFHSFKGTCKQRREGTNTLKLVLLTNQSAVKFEVCKKFSRNSA